MSRHDELDSQLPWIQVHRSVGAKAAALAARCGADYYRVRGILDAFWESLADRRVLADALPPKGPGCVVLDSEEVASRVCRIISPTCTPEDLEAAGFVEPFDDLQVHPRPVSFWRVRGMSRYLDAERTRLARPRGSGRRGSVSAKVRFEVILRDGSKCRYCGSQDDLQADHIIPVAQGGSDDASNLAACCASCNQGKADRLLSEVAQ